MFSGLFETYPVHEGAVIQTITFAFLLKNSQLGPIISTRWR